MTSTDKIKKKWRLFWGEAPENSLKSRKGCDIEDFWIEILNQQTIAILEEVKGKIEAKKQEMKNNWNPQYNLELEDKIEALDQSLSIINQTIHELTHGEN